MFELPKMGEEIRCLRKPQTGPCVYVPPPTHGGLLFGRPFNSGDLL
jgi:hypothetical protein